MLYAAVNTTIVQNLCAVRRFWFGIRTAGSAAERYPRQRSPKATRRLCIYCGSAALCDLGRGHPLSVLIPGPAGVSRRGERERAGIGTSATTPQNHLTNKGHFVRVMAAGTMAVRFAPAPVFASYCQVDSATKNRRTLTNSRRRMLCFRPPILGLVAAAEFPIFLQKRLFPVLAWRQLVQPRRYVLHPQSTPQLPGKAVAIYGR